MAQPLYRRIVHGYVEQVYDALGTCVSQEFVALESQPVERRYVAPADAEAAEDELEDDELIEHPDDLETIEQVERFQPYDMVQPPKPKKRK
jgi:hypothetical protein